MNDEKLKKATDLQKDIMQLENTIAYLTRQKQDGGLSIGVWAGNGVVGWLEFEEVAQLRFMLSMRLDKMKNEFEQL